MINWQVIVFVAILLSGIGLLDLWADFRKLNVEPEEESNEN